MKKTIAILLVLVIAGVGLFAAQATESVLTVNTKVLGVLELGIFSSAKTGVSTFDGTGVVATATIADIDQETAGPAVSNTLYLAVRTNQRVTTHVGLNASALKNGALAEYMAYNIKFGTPDTGGVATSQTIAAAAGPTIIADVATIAPETGLRVLNFPFDINITKEQYDAATIGDYVATLTFTVTAS